MLISQSATSLRGLCTGRSCKGTLGGGERKLPVNNRHSLCLNNGMAAEFSPPPSHLHFVDRARNACIAASVSELTWCSIPSLSVSAVT